MCITQVTSYEFAGKLYPTALEAVTAGLHAIAADIKQYHHSDPFTAFIKHDTDLIFLLGARKNLLAENQAATEVTSEKAETEPMPVDPRDHLLVLRDRVKAWYRKSTANYDIIFDWLKERGSSSSVKDFVSSGGIQFYQEFIAWSQSTSNPVPVQSSIDAHFQLIDLYNRAGHYTVTEVNAQLRAWDFRGIKHFVEDNRNEAYLVTLETMLKNGEEK